MLSNLQKRGKKLVLATSKPEVFALQILEHFGISDYFTKVCGSTLDESRTDKIAVIAYALQGITEKATMVMVGDREHDIIGAKENGIDSIGVLYGFGSRQELESAGAGAIVETVTDLENLLLAQS